MTVSRASKPQRALDFGGDFWSKIVSIALRGVMEAVLCAKLVRNVKAYGAKIVYPDEILVLDISVGDEASA